MVRLTTLAGFRWSLLWGLSIRPSVRTEEIDLLKFLFFSYLFKVLFYIIVVL